VTCLLDINLLMALLWENHEHHALARRWLRSVTAFATCPVSQLGFARVSSHPILGYGLTPEQAFSVLRRFLTDPRHRFVPDDLSCEDRVVRTDLMGGPKPGYRPLSGRAGPPARLHAGHPR
jgi:predicted nucleic acid-binding protein